MVSEKNVLNVEKNQIFKNSTIRLSIAVLLLNKTRKATQLQVRHVKKLFGQTCINRIDRRVCEGMNKISKNSPFQKFDFPQVHNRK